MTPLERLCFALADRLHQPVSVVRAMPARDMLGWVRYLREQQGAPDGAQPSPNNGTPDIATNADVALAAFGLSR